MKKNDVQEQDYIWGFLYAIKVAYLYKSKNRLFNNMLGPNKCPFAKQTNKNQQ